jgi:hypothetical protein
VLLEMYSDVVFQKDVLFGGFSCVGIEGRSPYKKFFVKFSVLVKYNNLQRYVTVQLH